MFSARTAWSRDPNPLAVTIEAAKKRYDLRDLTASNPTKVDLPIDRAAVGAAIAAGAKADYEPAALGIEKARVAIADYYGRRGVAVDPSQVFVTATTSEAYTHVFRLIADPGDVALAARPGYPLFSYLAEAAQIGLDEHPLTYSGRWRLDPPALEREVHGRTRVLLIVNPGNPTGACFGAVDRRRLLGLAAERGLAVISDEVFLDYLEQPERFGATSFARTPDVLTFTLSGLSKVAALPHLKLSWGVVSGPPELREEALGRLEVLADTYLSASTPVQEALPELLELAEDTQGHLRDRLMENGRVLEQAAGAAGLEVLERDGGWYAALRLPAGADDEGVAIDLVKRAQVITQPGYLYDLESPACLVVSLLPPPEAFEGAIRDVIRHLAG